MKKIILTALLFASMFSIANNFEEKQPLKISEQDRIQITNDRVAAVYFWEIKTSTGMASGFTNSQESANRTIKLMSTSDVVSSKVIEIYKN